MIREIELNRLNVFEQLCINSLTEAKHTEISISEHLADGKSFWVECLYANSARKYLCLFTDTPINVVTALKLLQLTRKTGITHGIISNSSLSYFARRLITHGKIPYSVSIFKSLNTEIKPNTDQIASDKEQDLTKLDTTYETLNDLVNEVENDDYLEDDYSFEYDDDDELVVQTLPKENIADLGTQSVILPKKTDTFVNNSLEGKVAVQSIKTTPKTESFIMPTDYSLPDSDLLGNTTLRKLIDSCSNNNTNYKINAIFPIGTTSSGKTVFLDFEEFSSVNIFDESESHNIFELLLTDFYFLKNPNYFEIHIISDSKLKAAWKHRLPCIVDNSQGNSPIEQLSELATTVEQTNKTIFVFIPNVHIFSNDMDRLISSIHFLLAHKVKIIIGIHSIIRDRSKLQNKYKRLYESIELKLISKLQDQRVGNYIDSYYKDRLFENDTDMLLLKKGTANPPSIQIASVENINLENYKTH